MIDETTRTHLENIRSKDKVLQNVAFEYLMAATAVPVEWAYEAWDDMVAGLSDKDNRVRAITSQVLCNLAQSDPEKRMLADFDKLLLVTKDERFVTARHCLQAIWKVGLAGSEQREMVVAGLNGRYQECITGIFAYRTKKVYSKIPSRVKMIENNQINGAYLL